MAYTIDIEYSTGNSFGANIERDEIGPAWQSLDKAKLALQYIKEHHEAYEAQQLGNRKEYKTIEENIKTKPWYSGKCWQYGLKLELDDCTMIETSCFWIGYFETLIEARIVQLPEEDIVYKP